MASSDERPKADAKRMGSRNFGGYLLDRATGRADFKKDAGPSTSALAATYGARNKMLDDAEKKDVGYAKGGLVADRKDAAGGPAKVRRGFGKARNSSTT